MNSHDDSQEQSVSYDDKPKNDNKPKNKQDWGWFKWLLLVWGVNSIRNFEAVFELQSVLNDYYQQADAVFLWAVPYLQTVVVIESILIFAVIVCCWGLWKWKRWAFYGLSATMLIRIVINLITPLVVGTSIAQGLFIAGAMLIPLGILYLGTKNKTQFLT